MLPHNQKHFKDEYLYSLILTPPPPLILKLKLAITLTHTFICDEHEVKRTRLWKGICKK